MKRRQWLIAAGLLGMGAFPAPAQRSRAVPRIGMLWIGSGNDSIFVTAFRKGMHARGHVDDGIALVDSRSLVDRYDQLELAAERLVKQEVDVLVCYGATATLAARKATSVVPIVMITGTDPVKLGVVTSLARPGGNVTGVTFLHPQLDGKRLEVLREMVPNLRRVGVLLNPASATEGLNFPRWEEAARRLGLEVQPVEIRLPSDIDRVISDIPQTRIEALAIVGGTMFVANRRQIVSAIAKVRLPAIYGSSDYPEVGGLISYGPNVSEGFYRAASHVDKILKGAKPAEIPIEQATTFELALNLKTARDLDIAIPRSIMLRADKVIE